MAKENVKELGSVDVAQHVKNVKITANMDFPWAYNKLKLKQAYAKLVEEQKLDKSVVINEESMKAMYISLAGLLTSEQEINILKKRPRSTSNIAE